MGVAVLECSFIRTHKHILLELSEDATRGKWEETALRVSFCAARVAQNIWLRTRFNFVTYKDETLDLGEKRVAWLAGSGIGHIF